HGQFGFSVAAGQSDSSRCDCLPHGRWKNHRCPTGCSRSRITLSEIWLKQSRFFFLTVLRRATHRSMNGFAKNSLQLVEPPKNNKRRSYSMPGAHSAASSDLSGISSLPAAFALEFLSL